MSNMTNTKTIARNTGWFSIENIINAVVAFTTSIAINRYLGPEKNSYLIYVSYIANLVSSLGRMGIPATTRKYMAEFIGMGDRGTARYIYLRTLAAADWFGDAGYLRLSLLGAQVDARGIQASHGSAGTQHLAGDDQLHLGPGQHRRRRFVEEPARLHCRALTYFMAIAATVVLHWGVVGVGASLLLMRSVDFLVRFFPTMKRVLAWETTHVHPPGLAPAHDTVRICRPLAACLWRRSSGAAQRSFC
jgi:hypothetical protein